MHLRLKGNGRKRHRCQLSEIYQLETQFPIYQLLTSSMIPGSWEFPAGTAGNSRIQSTGGPSGSTELIEKIGIPSTMTR
jgi:hypothetical protein